MKTIFTLFLSIHFLNSGLLAKEWVEMESSRPAEPVWEVNMISRGHLEISFELGGYFIDELENGRKLISFPGGVSMLQEGTPDLPRMAQSIMIPDLAHMELSILEADFVETSISDIASSKGNITRDIDLASVPYAYGKEYETDAFFPEQIVFLRDPYILRTIRGQAVVFQPIQYNPIQRILRIYTNIKIGVQENGTSTVNPLLQRPMAGGSREFENMYREHFINYTTEDRYAPLSEHGPMRIISYGGFMEALQPFVDWKNYKGIPTEMVDVADVGTIDDIDAYIESEYYEDGIAFVLLVGDIAQIESIRRSEGAGSNSPSDNSFTFIAGNDF